jgi:hypothetical protein
MYFENYRTTEDEIIAEGGVLVFTALRFVLVHMNEGA